MIRSPLQAHRYSRGPNNAGISFQASATAWLLPTISWDLTEQLFRDIVVFTARPIRTTRNMQPDLRRRFG